MNADKRRFNSTQLNRIMKYLRLSFLSAVDFVLKLITKILQLSTEFFVTMILQTKLQV
jgi:hypothetical protein